MVRGRLPCILNSSTGFDQLLLYCKIRELGGDSWVRHCEDFLGLVLYHFLLETEEIIPRNCLQCGQDGKFFVQDIAV